MRAAIIEALGNQRDRGRHPGLLLQRYLFENATGDDGNPGEKKKALLKHAIDAARDSDVQALYQAAFKRWSDSLGGLPNVQSTSLHTVGRLIVGLGSENVLEAGIRLNHVYGMPIIPGSALKGLAAHYCDWVWGGRDDKDDPALELAPWRRENGDYHKLLFGTTDDGGCVVFHDAWLVPGGSPLALDVMTPHHSGWNDLEDPKPPTDYDSPKPVPFLSARGTFHVAVSWRGPEHDQAANWTKLALDLLREALEDWGAGGKTTSGYGRLTDPPPPPPPKPRKYGDKARVEIVARRRPKKGFYVQDVEPGRNRGIMSVDDPPPGVEPNVGDVVEVFVQEDKPGQPLYRWLLPKKK